MKRVIVIAVHPDDETLGCGGTLLKHKEYGDEIYWLIVTSASTDHGFPETMVQKRDAEIKAVTLKYNFNKVFQLDFPTRKLDLFPVDEIISRISSVFEEVKPNVVFLPFKGDVHTDHQIVFECAFSCTKSFRFPSVKKVMMMETLSETEFAAQLSENAFLPNYFVNISEQFEQKKEILNIYQSELKSHPFPRSLKNVEALATLRGAQSGVQYAEAFMLLKSIVDEFDK